MKLDNSNLSKHRTIKTTYFLAKIILMQLQAAIIYRIETVTFCVPFCVRKFNEIINEI